MAGTYVRVHLKQVEALKRAYRGLTVLCNLIPGEGP
jgi:hypothetical protein